ARSSGVATTGFWICTSPKTMPSGALLRPPRPLIASSVGVFPMEEQRPCQRLLVGDRAGVLAAGGDCVAGGQRHQAGVIGDGDEAEALADHLRGIAWRAVMDAGEQVALLAGGQEFIIDSQYLWLVAIELGHQAERQAEIAGADI